MTTGTSSRLSAIHISPQEPCRESLVACLQAILRVYGRDANYHELMSLTGAAFMTSYAADAPPNMRWNVCGRHAFLVAAARLYGLELRELHPPDAAPSVPVPREFDWHFRDSYLPFIRTGLDRDEPLLAWMGWPAPHSAEWGVITCLDESTNRCRGMTRGGNAELVAAPIQVYQVIGYEPPETDCDYLVDVVVKQARTIQGGGVDPCYGVSTGMSALSGWRRILETLSQDADERTAARDGFKACLGGMIDGRDSATRFFAALKGQVGQRHLSLIEEWLMAFEGTAGGLAPWRDAPVIDEAFASGAPAPGLMPLLDLMVENENTAADILRATRG